MFAAPQPADATIVRMVTVVGSFNVELYDEAPITVANFLKYVTNGNYNNSFIHRHAFISSSGVSVLQGGGFRCCNNGQFDRIPANPPIVNEFDPSRSNIRGTIAMAKTSDPNSATSEWFINLDDNSVALDDTNNSGGFTVFGRIMDPGMKVVVALAALDVYNFTPFFPNFPFGEIPVINYVYPGPLLNSNFVYVYRVCVNDDADGSCPGFEDLAPNNGDGNGDDVPDRDQSNVTTILTSLGGTATFEAEPIMRLDPVDAVDSSTAKSWLTIFKSPPDQSVYFNNGMFNLTMLGNMGATGHTLTVYDGASTRPTRYYAFGPTLDNKDPHWYDFTFDGVTGAEIMSDRVVLHFVDGMRGDGDYTANDSITHTGGQAILTPLPPSSTKSGGCTIATSSSQAWRNGDWALVAVFLVVLALVRKRIRRNRI